MHDIILIESHLRQLGLQAGMNLLVHSSLRRVGPVEGGADAIIDCLLCILGPEGTLMMSTVSGNVNRDQPVFHVQETPSTVGTLGNIFRRRPGAIRSLHPVHSIVAMGPKAEFFTSGHLEARTPWSPDSPYGKLMRNRGHILFLGTNFTCNTCIHALEIEARVPGLHTEETTTLHVCDAQGQWHAIEHHWHAPKKDYYVDMEHLVAQAGGLQFGLVGNGISRLCNAEILRQTVLPILQKTPECVIRRLSSSNYIWE
ncbi:MAG TPA: AAC(3) family N-acetyltransferase [Lentisphaeria bacterium]|nr:AAC(3) family N-acetyltransferase [Lentisphaerota bacterium]HQC51955.1 AAC(3) family N-acetyltransferase [Lentisphaeria bacterium]HQL88040.1 AAC(3) family N-acetyltransferase [Lentisphaeria bacterium]